MSGKRRNTYLALMGLGAIALLVDRVLLPGSEPAPAEAKTHEGRAGRSSAASRRSARNPAKAVAGKGSAPTSLASIPELPFPRNLPAMDESTPLRDLFVPADSRDRGSATTPGGQRLDRAGASAAQFAGLHKLDAVLLHEDEKIAMVNGAPLKEGDSLEGCRLVRISATSVEFSCQGAAAELKLSNPLEKSRQ